MRYDGAVRRRNEPKLEPEDIGELLRREWTWEERPRAGFVALVEQVPDDQGAALRTAVRRYASQRGLPIRMPHPSVSAMGLVGRPAPGAPSSEFDQAMGGILYLEDLTAYSDRVLRMLRERLEESAPQIVVIGVEFGETLAGDLDPLRDVADLLGLHLYHYDELVHKVAPPGDEPGEPIAEALAAIQRHRAALGMRPLDPALADWTEEDIVLEAERIARLPNPLEDPRAEIERLKARLTAI